MSKNFQIILKDNKTGKELQNFETNLVLCVANIKPAKKGELQTQEFIFGIKGINGHKVLNLLQDTQNYVEELKNELIIENFKLRNTKEG
jgi:hypothetical protein